MTRLLVKVSRRGKSDRWEGDIEEFEKIVIQTRKETSHLKNVHDCFVESLDKYRWGI